jgi:hypothetical protein
MQSIEYILYKNPIQLETLYIVQYIHSLGISLLPKAIFERGIPIEIYKLPSIYDINEKILYHGLDETIEFYEKKTKIKKLLSKSYDFKAKNPNYSIKESDDVYE